MITVCDGSPQNPELTPYANTWTPDGNGFPLELALAVDYDGDGQRDEMEPIIRSGHERWDDWGEDGISSSEEEGYLPGVREDPAGDDYDAQYNPRAPRATTVTGGRAIRRPRPRGVLGTLQQPPGGCGQARRRVRRRRRRWEVHRSSGLQALLGPDAHWSSAHDRQGAERRLNDDALARLDLWTDGGTARPLQLRGSTRSHLVGTFAARGRDVTYYTGFTEPVGLDPAQPESFVPRRIVYDDVPGIVLQRYGMVDPSPEDVEAGSGQHVGKGTEIANRLQTALYFIGSRWKEPDLRQYVRDGASKPAPKYETGEGDQCEITGNCEFEFESQRPQGAVCGDAAAGLRARRSQSRRLPGHLLLHGYGNARGPGPAIVFLPTG